MSLIAFLNADSSPKSQGSFSTIWYLLWLTQQLAAKHYRAAHSPLSFPPLAERGGEWTKRETHGLRERQFNTTTK